MKKQDYIKPRVKMLVVGNYDLLTGSGVTGDTGDGSGPGYGGSDDDGSLDPSAKDFDCDCDAVEGSIWEY
ncbi:MAG: hypothetical protein IKS72_08235 [Prevotella sp.]|nr:hypothetical protein [Prevotella sp.]